MAGVAMDHQNWQKGDRIAWAAWKTKTKSMTTARITTAKQETNLQKNQPWYI